MIMVGLSCSSGHLDVMSVKAKERLKVILSLGGNGEGGEERCLGKKTKCRPLHELSLRQCLLHVEHQMLA